MADVGGAPHGYEHKQSLDKNKLSHLRGNDNNQGDVARSVKSEFDYDSKKKFTDVLGQPNKAAQLARLQQEF